MQIRRYQAASLREAFSLIRADLGPEAVIIGTRKVRGGVEVSAAIDHDVAAEAPTSPSAARAPGADLRDLRLDLAALRQLVLGAGMLAGQDPGQAALYGWLTGRGLPSEVALELVSELKAEADWALPPTQTALSRLTEAVSRLVTAGGWELPGRGTRQALALVGPTGVGKTTMLAKLAARLSRQDDRRVGLISCDSYRIGAPDQVRSFARVLDLPLRLCESPSELGAALAGFRDRDVLLIDTPGCSPHDAERLAEMAVLRECGAQSHLVLSATTREEEMAAAIRGFEETGFASVIFTKLDEAERFGALVGAASRSRRPISWLGTGQRVPGDLQAASPEGVARLVLTA
jgi:flagellar biosynthesis protein FlhF